MLARLEGMDLIMTPLRSLVQRKMMSTNYPMLLHSDQGSQYSSAGLVSLLAQYNVIQSMSRASNRYDNAVMESFWDVLRTLCVFISVTGSAMT